MKAEWVCLFGWYFRVSAVVWIVRGKKGGAGVADKRGMSIPLLTIAACVPASAHRIRIQSFSDHEMWPRLAPPPPALWNGVHLAMF